MQLIDVSLRSGSETWLYPFSLTVARGEINVLLGATRAGKTSLLRILAGLQRPTAGRVISGDADVTDVPVRERNVAMVYQQFINYPSFSVFDNIASPLHVAGLPGKEIRERVTTLAEMLRLSPFLSRFPGELSGGQQQRVALARALAKNAELLLLDEPLVNLDYKLREELRNELPRLFARQNMTVVYATTEPHEALLLGGRAHLLVAGRLVQSGPTLDLFRRPSTLAAAQAFSDPPLNVIPAKLDFADSRAVLADGSILPLPGSRLAALPASAGEVMLGLRPHQLALAPDESATCRLEGRVDLAEISGSETFVHVSRDGGASLVAQVPGVHRLAIGEPRALYFKLSDLYCFDENGALLFSPGH